MKRGPELKHSKHETYRKQIRSMRKIQTQRHQSEAIMLPNACRGRPAECAPRLPEAALDGVDASIVNLPQDPCCPACGARRGGSKPSC